MADSPIILLNDVIHVEQAPVERPAARPAPDADQGIELHACDALFAQQVRAELAAQAAAHEEERDTNLPAAALLLYYQARATESAESKKARQRHRGPDETPEPDEDEPR